MRKNRLGIWSATAVIVIGGMYVATLGVGVAVHGLATPIGDPILAIMEILTLLSALAVVLLMVAIHDYASGPRKPYGLIAVAFTIVFAGTTSVVHFVELTALRQSGAGGIVWPSPLYAAELAAWDLFLGLALLFAAPVFEGGGLAGRARHGLLISGSLSLAGIIGPAVGDMRLQRVGILGYAVVFPLVCFTLARLFRVDSDEPPSPA